MIRIPALVVVFIGLGGCFRGAYDPAKLEPAEVDASVPDAAYDAASDGEVDGGETCTLRAIPERPSAEDGAGTDVTFALRDIVLDPATFEDGGWHRFSYDLDGVCTSGVDTQSCASTVVVGDGPAGQDNVFAQIFVQALEDARNIEASLQDHARITMASGDNVPLIRLEGWNGLEDDPQVRVWMAASADVVSGVGGSQAVWDGRDVHYPNVDDFSLGDISAPNIVDDNAYVSGRKLVALLPFAPIFIPQGSVDGVDYPPLEISLADAHLVATIGIDNTRLDDVLILGRWSITRINESISSIGICAGTDERMTLDFLLNQFADMRANPEQDNADPLATCDALSVGLAFGGYSVILGSEARDRPDDPSSACD